MALASKETEYLSNMMAYLGFGKLFENAPLFGDSIEPYTSQEPVHRGCAQKTPLYAYFT